MSILELPDGYKEIKRVNLQKDKKLAVIVNVASIILMVLLTGLGLVIAPFSFAIGAGDFGAMAWSLLALIILTIAYFISHELIHGLFIKKYSGEKAKYGFTGLYAYAGSDAYFNKRQYLIIALAPVVIFGIIFLALNLILPTKWFWLIYVLQIINLSGAVGDLYITYLMCKAPADVLTHDEGIEMIFYSRSQPG